jgi:hypothetical protein
VTRSALLSAWALAMAALFLIADPDQALALPALKSLLWALISTVTWCVASIGAGGALLHRLSPTLLDDEDGGIYALCVGLLLWGLLLAVLALAGGLGPAGFIATAALLSTGWLLRPRIRWPSLPPATIAALVVITLLGLIDASAPPIDTDELYYHLALPAEMLRTGELLGGMLRPDGSRPMILHLPFAALLSSGGESAPRLLHLALVLLLLSALVSVSRRHLGGPSAGVWAGWLLVSSWSVAHDAGLAANNLPTALAVLLTVDCALRGERRALPLLAGLALSLKYTAAGAITGAWLVARLPWSTRIATGLAALAIVSPWWLINLGSGLHPLFPFTGWSGDVSFQYLEKYGYGRSPQDLLLLPYRAIMRADIDSFQLLGRLSPGFAALLPAALLSAWRHDAARRLWGVSVAVLLLWALGPHWLRYLLPGLPILALALAAGISETPRAARVALALVIVAGLPANWGPLLEHAADRLPAATGQESRDAYLERKEETWPALRWANAHLPADAEVAILYAWTGYLLERPYVLSSVEDHIPVRHWILTHGERSLDALREAGVSHLVVGRTLPIRRVYPFLSKEEFERGFAEPSHILEDLLLRESILLYEEGRLRVYRLREKAP